MKKRGFTLAELIISMTLLSFIIFMASILFDRAIKIPDTLEQVIVSNAGTYSGIESAIYNARHDKGSIKNPSNPSVSLAPIKLKNVNVMIDGRNIKDVEGYMISSKANVVKYNQYVQADDDLFTFVGRGHTESPVANVKKVGISKTSGERFKYFSMADVSASITTEYESETNDNFKRVRVRVLKSPVNSTAFENLYLPYTDHFDDNNPVYFRDVKPLTPSLFELAAPASDELEGKHLGSSTNMINGFQSAPVQYLDSIDRTFASYVIALNKNGHSSAPLYSLSNTDIGSMKALHFIGLPYAGALSAHYDYNLALAPSKTQPNKYLSLFDMEKIADTNFTNLLKRNGDKYEFDWGNFDIRNIIQISGASPVSDISISQGFLYNVSMPLDSSINSSSVSKDVPNAQKSYGNTVYYNSNAPIAKFRLSKGKAYTFFAKFNMHNHNIKKHNSSELSPFSLLSVDWDYAQGSPISGGTQGFSVLSDTSGELYLDSSEVSLKEELRYNITDNALYKDQAGGLNFNRLKNDVAGVRDGRENFQIFAFVIDRTSAEDEISVYTLKSIQKEVNIGSKTQKFAATEPMLVKKFKIQIGTPVAGYEFGGMPSYVPTTISPQLQDALGGSGAIEISDMILYEEDLSKRKIKSDDYVSLTMEYLYRKYLTEYERKTNHYDNYFIGKYH